MEYRGSRTLSMGASKPSSTRAAGGTASRGLPEHAPLSTLNKPYSDSSARRSVEPYRPGLQSVPSSKTTGPSSRSTPPGQTSQKVASTDSPRRRRVKRRVTPRFFRLVASLVMFIVLLAYGVAFLRGFQIEREIVSVKRQIEAAQVRNQQLRAEIKEVTSDQYVEESARQDLGLVKPGETAWVVVKPEDPKSPFKVEKRNSQAPVADAEGW